MPTMGLLHRIGCTACRLAGIGGVALCLSLGAAQATAVKEAPWRPAAAAYRATLFFANLDPVPWPLIADTWHKPYDGAATITPGHAAISASAGQASADAIDAAIAAQDSDALFAAINRALAGALLHHLDRAAAGLDARQAAGPIATARELYRAIEDGIAAADPQNARSLGLAWLDLSTAAGSRGVLGAGATDADRARFDAARAVIVDYITANFAPRAFSPRGKYLPVPESHAQADMPAWLPPGAYLGDQTPLPRLVLRFEEQGIDEATLPLIAYGDMLFDSPEMYGEPARSLGISCSMCHNRGDANRALFIPGISARPGGLDVDGAFFHGLFNDRRDDHVDTPSLRGLRYTGPYGRIGRFPTIRAVTRNVIVAEFGGPEPTPFMLDAIVAYINEFDFLPNAKLTADGRLSDAASEAAHRGVAIFRQRFEGMGNMACADCHAPSANFVDGRQHNIGSDVAYAGDISGSFDTPTLLGSRFSAPYFHDGTLPTLASVIDWKNDRHGLGLSDAARADLTAYVEAVGDGDTPYEVFDERNTPFRLAFDELTTFATTLNVLLPRRDAHHALLLIDTVSKDLAADASAMGNLAAKPDIYALAEKLAAAGAAIRANDWAGAEAAWADFQTIQAEIDERVY